VLPAAAISFLTRIPVGRLVEVDGATVARAAPLYPLVGAGIGALAGLAVDVANGPLPPFAAAALGLALLAVVTGAMHLDALADTADALGGTTRERRLEIMRDHTIGAFGATALVLVLVFEASVLASTTDGWSAFAVAGACARWAPLPLAALLPAARPDGQGAALATHVSRPAVLAATLVAGGVALLLRRGDGLAALAAATAVVILLALFLRRWIGGTTGDTLGATTELAQAAALAAVLVAS
jgi:cobalamin 5'-phosphate synthase/cobalamin synthase